MHFSRNITIGDNLVKKKNKLIRQVKYGLGYPSVYLVYKNLRNNQLEFMHCLYFRQKYFKTQPIEVVAMYKSYNDALSYLVKDTVNRLGVTLEE